MKTIKFKTNIKCGGCTATVTPHLDALSNVDTWTVDTNVPEKVLTVNGKEGSLAEDVMAALDKAGFKAEQI